MLHRLFPLARRRISTAGTDHATTTEGSTKITERVETDAQGMKKTWVEQITHVQKSWSQASRRTKVIFSSYLAGAVLHNVYATYNTGKSALINYRGYGHLGGPHEIPIELREIKPNTSASYYNAKVKNEYDAVVLSTKDRAFRRFLSSIIWPGSVMSHAMPSLVMWLNPPLEKPLEKK